MKSSEIDKLRTKVTCNMHMHIV